MKTIGYWLLLLVTMSMMTFGQGGTCPLPGDDIYGTGPCCTQVATLPTFNTVVLPSAGVNMQGQWAMIDKCADVYEVNLDLTVKMMLNPVTVPFTNSGLIACDDVLFQVTGIDASGTFQMVIGTSLTSNYRTDWLLGKYIRTWTALGEDGSVIQYYRYLISGDAVFNSSLPTNLLPPCDANFSAVSMQGYIDLSCVQNLPDTSPPVPQASLVLSHYDGCLSHMDTPLNPARRIPAGGANKHVGMSYHLVAPGNFDFNATLLSPGRLTLPFSTIKDAVRSTATRTNSLNGSGPICVYEGQTAAASTNSSQSCLCDSAPTNRYYHQDILGSVQGCTGTGTSQIWKSIPLAPEIPTGFFQHQIGIWNSGARWDVHQVAPLVILGTFQYLDPCYAGYTQNENRIIYGTNSFYLATSNQPTLFNGVGPTDTMMDFGDNVGPSDLLTLGAPGYTNILWMISKQ